MIWQWISANWHKVGILFLLLKEFKVVFRAWDKIKEAYENIAVLFGKKKAVSPDEGKNVILQSLLSTSEGNDWVIKKLGL